MSSLLRELADKLHICTDYVLSCDNNRQCVASDELLKFFIENMGYGTKDDEDILASLKRLSHKRWQRAMESIYVVNEGDVCFDVVLRSDEADNEVVAKIAIDGEKDFFDVELENCNEEKCVIGRTEYVHRFYKIKNELQPQYYQLKFKTNKKEYSSVLAVAPYQCYGLDKKGKEKLFGFALQLYSLKSKRNWGVGDFSDLKEMVSLLAQSGGDIIGLNPLNVLHHNDPELASPYASISRLFLNPIYIDVESVPLFQAKDKNEKLINELREKENIDYTGVYNAKIKALKAIYQRMIKDKKSDYAKAFEIFKKENGAELYNLAIFQTIADEKYKEKKYLVQDWGKELGSLLGSKVKEFAKENEDKIDFFMFLQFEADRQLKAVFENVKDKGLAVGLYRDLPVGVSKDSAEVWEDRYLYMQRSGAGAPPDTYFPTGQKWMLGAFNLFELKERAYKPFIKILRANMKYAGAIRIDHVMGLSRLYIIPDDGVEGTYIRYFEKDMMNILALESYLNKCVVVGECIGNVADGFREMLEARNIYSLGVLWAERKDCYGTMKKPCEYGVKYFASVGTHDMPPLKAWWFGREIGLMSELKLYGPDETRNAYLHREKERRLLLNTLDDEKVWPEDNYRKADYLYGEGYPEGIDEAVSGYMAKTCSEVFMLQLEDVFQSMKIQNLPGTDIDLYPNWRSKIDVDIEDMYDNRAYQRHLAMVKKYR